MDIKEKVLSLMLEGKSISEVTLELSADENYSSDQIASGIVQSQKAFDALQKTKEIKKEFEMKEQIEIKAQEIADQKLREIKLETEIKDVKEVKEAWKEEVGRQFHLFYKLKTHGLSSKESEELSELSQKAIRVNQEYEKKTTNSGFVASTASDAGYLIRREFESQVDSLLYQKSEFLNRIKMRPETEKIAIHGVGTVSLAFRTNDDTNFAKTKPTTYEDTLDLKDAGGIVPVSNRALNASYYQIPGILAERFSDAKIRLLEPLIIQGYASGSDAFNGVHFTSGITTVDAKNKGGSGLITNADLTNMYIASKDQISDDPSAAFVMRKIEFFILKNERDKNGQKVDNIITMGTKHYHKDTGKEIIIVNNLSADLNGVTNRSGSGVPVIFGIWNNFYCYTNGLRIDTSQDIYFDYDQSAIRFVMPYSQTLASLTKAAFVSLLGITTNAVPNT